MSLKGIMSIAGKPGLYKVVATMANGFIVEGMEDNKRMPVTSTHKISMLDDISVFTEEGDLNLKDVLLKIKEKNPEGISVTSKSSTDELKSFFTSAVPHYDKERVYVSDIKKIVNWYKLVKDIVDTKDEEEETSEDKKSESKETEAKD